MPTQRHAGCGPEVRVDPGIWFQDPVLARSDGEVVDGQLRLKAARKLGITEIPEILCDEWTPAQVKAFRLMVTGGWMFLDKYPPLTRAEIADIEARARRGEEPAKLELGLPLPLERARTRTNAWSRRWLVSGCARTRSPVWPVSTRRACGSTSADYWIARRTSPPQRWAQRCTIPTTSGRCVAAAIFWMNCHGWRETSRVEHKGPDGKALIPFDAARALLESAADSRPAEDPTPAEAKKLKSLPIQVGIDVAGPGEDETVWPRVPAAQSLRPTHLQITIPAGALCRCWGARSKPADSARWLWTEWALDTASRCTSRNLGFPVILFIAGHRPMDSERFVNTKAEAYRGLREWMEQGQVCKLNDLETEAQLSAILCRARSAGKTEIESKEDASKRGQASPDRAEALVMAFCKIVPREQTIVLGERVQISRY